MGVEQTFVECGGRAIRFHELRSLVPLVVAGDFFLSDQIAVFFAPGVDVTQQIVELHTSHFLEAGISRGEDSPQNLMGGMKFVVLKFFVESTQFGFARIGDILHEVRDRDRGRFQGNAVVNPLPILPALLGQIVGQNGEPLREFGTDEATETPEVGVAKQQFAQAGKELIFEPARISAAAEALHEHNHLLVAHTTKAGFFEKMVNDLIADRNSGFFSLFREDTSRDHANLHIAVGGIGGQDKVGHRGKQRSAPLLDEPPGPFHPQALEELANKEPPLGEGIQLHGGHFATFPGCGNLIGVQAAPPLADHGCDLVADDEHKHGDNHRRGHKDFLMFAKIAKRVSHRTS